MTSRSWKLYLLGLVICGLTYAAYSWRLGWLDGLPALPSQWLQPADGSVRPPEQPVSPTIELLKQAFGPHSPEVESLGYPTRLAFRRGETTLVVACGRPPSQPDSQRVTVVPFSAALFGKPKPPHLLRPGEAVEISTLHADKAILEFDRVIRTPADMNEARLVGLELHSDPDAAVSRNDPRVGMVHLTHNQRSTDPNRWIVLRTVGPVFYRDKRGQGKDKENGNGPDLWTDAAVEIVDRSNVPQSGNGPVVTAATPAGELRQPSAVTAILSSRRLPPPTVQATGMRIYLTQESSASLAAAPPAGRRPQKTARPGGGQHLQRVELLERVLVHLWLEAGGTTLVGSRKPPPESSSLVAVAGGMFHAVEYVREYGRELLQVETRGPFVYDAEQMRARFEALPQLDPNYPNDVQVTRVQPWAGTQSLLTQVLELELARPPDASPLGASSPRVEPPAPPQQATHPSGGQLRKIRAWTYTPGRVLTVSSERDRMHATGTELVHEPSANRTVLTGTPLVAMHDRHVLRAGTPHKPAQLVIEPFPAEPPGPRAATTIAPARGRNRVRIVGPGQIDLHDPDRSAPAAVAWQDRLEHSIERVNDQELDVIVLHGNARYEDAAADYRLQGERMQLWVRPHPSGGNRLQQPSPSGSQLQRVFVAGRVRAHSADLEIEDAEQLNVLIRDERAAASPGGTSQQGTPSDTPVPPPERKAAVTPPGVASPRGNGPIHPANSPPAVTAATPPGPRKPPLIVQARTIDTWVVRRGRPSTHAPAKPAAPNQSLGPQGVSVADGAAYRLEQARCEGLVHVRQASQPPGEKPGTDIRGSLLIVEHSPAGSVLTVHGWDNRPAEIHHQGTSLIGPWIKLDQLRNLAVIEGRGSVAVPASTDLAGNPLRQPEPVVIHFRDGMTFKGALKTAEFFGRVSVAHGDSGLTCHTMRVIFDRPVYFTAWQRQQEQIRRPTPEPGPSAAPPPRAGSGAAMPPTAAVKSAAVTKPPAIANPPAPADPATTVTNPAAPADPSTPAADDSPRIEAVHCYPAPADIAEHERETLVFFHQIDRDPHTGRLMRQQQLEAQELTLLAQVRDAEDKAPYRFLEAHGPGVVRLWGPVTDDAATVGSPARTDGQMALTIIHFSRRMIAKDKGRNYKEATFYDQVQLVHLPTDDPHLEVKRAELPPRATLLHCLSKLVVWSYRRGEEPPRQHMHAYGNAYLQTDDYAGSAEIIKNDGKLVVLEGLGTAPATIRRRFGGDEQTARRIVYDRASRQFTVEGSIGGTIVAPGRPPTPPAAPNR